MINVLVTSLGSNTAVGVVKALRTHQGISITGTDIFPAHLSAGSSFVDYFIQLPLAVADNYETELVKVIRENKIHCVIPIHDVEVEKISCIAEKKPSLTFWAVNNPDIIRLCNHKKNINHFLSRHNINVPQSYEPFDELTYPLIFKPNQGVSSKGIRIINTEADLNNIDNFETGFLQKLVNGDEYTVDCYTAYNQDFFNCCVRKRIETKEGISTKGLTVDFPMLENISAQIHNLLQYKGASNIQFIVENNIPYFIEINPRFSGAGVLSYHANLNSPLFTALEAVQSPLFDDLKKIPVKKGIYMTRYWSENFYEG